MGNTRKLLRTLLLLYLLLGGTCAIRLLVRNGVIFQCTALSSCYMLILALCFFLYINWVTVKGPIRNHLLFCAGMLVFFFIIRATMYVAVMKSVTLSILVWYLYYIPMISISYSSLRTALHIGQPDAKKLSGKMLFFDLLCIVLCILVLTNNLHHLVFKPRNGLFSSSYGEYSYALGYYIIYGWIYLMLFATYGIMIRKCRVANLWKYVWAPMIPVFTGTVSLLLLAMSKMPKIGPTRFIEFPESYGFIIISIWVLAIKIGLLPSNSCYTGLFQNSGIKAKITDREDAIVYPGSYDETVDATSSDIQIHREPVHGGYFYYQADISELNRMNRELASIQEELKKENELIRLENQLKEENASIEAKNSLYDAIAFRVQVQSQKISELSAIRLEDSEKQKHVLLQINFFGTYIKRMANLMLLSSQKCQINGMELALSCVESLRNLQRLGILTAYFTEESYPDLDAEVLICIYEIFETCIEQAMQGLDAITIHIKKDQLRLVLEGSGAEHVNPGKAATVERDDDVCFVTMFFEKGGKEA